MAAEIIDVDFKEKTKRETNRIKTNLSNKFYNFKYRCKRGFVTMVEHPQESLAAIAVLTAGYSLGRRVIRDIKPTTTDKLMKRQEYSQYDNQLNVWWDLKHKMTNTEKIEFEARRRNGESVSDALRAMNLLKRR